MRMSVQQKAFLLMLLLISLVLPSLSSAAMNANQAGFNQVPLVSFNIANKAVANKNWKLAYATAPNAQVVFMDVCPKTNPANEVGVEKHPFDQVIYIAQGDAEVILNGQHIKADAGDMIFIPQGTVHNVINLNQHKPLKLISVYSSNDIPAHAVYPTKASAF